jgi:hypothetical protein
MNCSPRLSTGLPWSGFLFDNFLNEAGAGVESLDEEARAGLEPFVQMKMKQLRAYDYDCKKLL